MYKDLQQIVPTQKRAEINDKILYCIDTHNKAVTSEVVYNCYTGAGGLHNLSFNDFNNFHDYTEAKKEFEMGQFFTPHAVCQLMVEMAAPSQSDRVADFCCGMGNFFNWLPDGTYTYGSELDPKAVRWHASCIRTHISNAGIFSMPPRKASLTLFLAIPHLI